MNNAEFLELSESLYTTLEDMLDEMIDAEQFAIDYETGIGVLTIICEDTNSQVIVSRQQAAHQIWVAAKSGGFHLDFIEGVWFCKKTEETLEQLLARTCSEQSTKDITFDGLDEQRG